MIPNRVKNFDSLLVSACSRYKCRNPEATRGKGHDCMQSVGKERTSILVMDDFTMFRRNRESTKGIGPDRLTTRPRILFSSNLKLGPRFSH